MASHGRYTVLKKLADGGMAELFLAAQSGMAGFERKVVLKRILPALSVDPQFRNMLIDEALLAMGMAHGNIAQVLDLGCVGSRYFLVMELVDGWDLAGILARAAATRMPLPSELGLHVLAQVCRGLFYAHQLKRDGRALGIVHRDVSPQNILISEQGEVKVADFGIAKAFVRRERTQTGVIKGKLDFMSPEQAAGAPLDARSDIFSAGSVLYLATTGRLPFPGKTPMETLLRIQNADCAPLSDVAPTLAPGAARVITRALARQPSDRYQTGEEMMFDIETVLRGDRRAIGQSDLKRWLDELGKRDGAVPISRKAGLPMQADQADDLAEGTSFALDDTSAVAKLGLASTQVAPGPAAEPRAAPAAPVAPSAPAVPAPIIIQAAPPRGSWLRAVGNGFAALIVLLALAAGVVYTVAPKVWHGLLARAERIATTTRSYLPKDLPTIRRFGPVPPETRRAPEADGKPRAPAPAPAPAKPPAPVPAKPPIPRVTVQLLSVPTAADVRTPDGESIGRTPTRILAGAGDRIALRFSKPGYATVTQTVTVRASGDRVLVRLRPRAR